VENAIDSLQSGLKGGAIGNVAVCQLNVSMGKTGEIAGFADKGNHGIALLIRLLSEGFDEVGACKAVSSGDESFHGEGKEGG
jgi:hypothetical protein